MRVGVLTSGGDAQGMNTCINVLAKIASFNKNIELWGVRHGFQGLIDDEFSPITYATFRDINHVGGTVLKSSRSRKFTTVAGLKAAVENIKKRKIDVLIVIGGDGSFRGLTALNDEGIKTIAIPATVDNDLYYTENALGFDSAVNVAVNAIESISQTMSSLDRACVVEVMGRFCGSIALFTAATCACEVVATNEYPLSEEEIVARVKKAISLGITSPLVIVSEHLYDIHKLATEIEFQTKKETKYNVLGYIQRGGSPSPKDRLLAMQFAVRAMELIEKGEFNRAVGIKDNKIIDVDMKTANKSSANFNEELFQLFEKLNS